MRSTALIVVLSFVVIIGAVEEVEEYWADGFGFLGWYYGDLAYDKCKKNELINSNKKVNYWSREQFDHLQRFLQRRFIMAFVTICRRRSKIFSMEE